MADTIDHQLLKDAMRLTESQRAALAAALIESLDGTADPDAEAAWAAEIERRLREVESGAVKTIPWNEARQRIAADERPAH